MFQNHNLLKDSQSVQLIKDLKNIVDQVTLNSLLKLQNEIEDNEG